MLEAFLSTRYGFTQLLGLDPAETKKHQTTLVATPQSFSPAITPGVALGGTYLADEGFNGKRWRVQKNAPNAWAKTDKKWFSKHRQIVETVFARLTCVFDLKHLKAHSDWGKITRLAAITAAYNLGILFNRFLNREDGDLETLIV